MQKTRGGAVVSINNALVNNCKFIDNYAPEGAAIYNEETYLKVNGSYFESSNLFQKAIIVYSQIQQQNMRLQFLMIEKHISTIPNLLI